VQDAAGARLGLAELAVPGASPRLARLWVDGAYPAAVAFAASYAGVTLEVVKRPDAAKGFVVVPRRWVVERTFGWLGRCRALSKDYEATTESGEAWIYLAMTHFMLKRLHPK
jgi:putative transposase